VGTSGMALLDIENSFQQPSKQMSGPCPGNPQVCNCAENHFQEIGNYDFLKIGKVCAECPISYDCSDRVHAYPTQKWNSIPTTWAKNTKFGGPNPQRNPAPNPPHNACSNGDSLNLAGDAAYGVGWHPASADQDCLLDDGTVPVALYSCAYSNHTSSWYQCQPM
jgi:hypothetical protein